MESEDDISQKANVNKVSKETRTTAGKVWMEQLKKWVKQKPNQNKKKALRSFGKKLVWDLGMSFSIGVKGKEGQIEDFN